MTRSQEKLLIAALAGLVIASAAAFVVGPALADGARFETPTQISAIAPLDMSRF